MQESKITAVRTANDRLATRRRAKRGLVAGYIHEISGRHAADAATAAGHRSAPDQGDVADARRRHRQREDRRDGGGAPRRRRPRRPDRELARAGEPARPRCRAPHDRPRSRRPRRTARSWSSRRRSPPTTRSRGTPSPAPSSSTPATTTRAATARSPRSTTTRTTSTEWLAAKLPGARVVKAFNTVHWEVLRDKGDADAGDDRLVVLVAGDDADAKQQVERLIEDIGFAPRRPGRARRRRTAPAARRRALREGAHAPRGAWPTSPS